jgi:hypothetical protein
MTRPLRTSRLDPDEQGSRRTLLGALRDVIAALDRRRPRHDGKGERAIVRDAASLRRVAVARVEALEREESSGLRAGRNATA